MSRELYEEQNKPPAEEGQTLMEQVEATRARAEEEKNKAEQYLRDLQRERAEFINFKRRAEQEKTEQARFANAMLILKLLPVLDDLERAVDTVGPELAGLNWVQGIVLIARKLRSTLEAEGLTQVPAYGAEFDPNLHEAVLHEEVDAEMDGKVVAVLQPGYKLHDRVIRPAMVTVGRGPAGHRVASEEIKRDESEA
ncbi:MAG: nucleotide exchange factor GrpE [Bacteroidetes bacterium]|nr:nucleotide exchange factor GrpE [Bacteroidota bacterium]MCL5026311.1 nucleotide exchange factor GrpE [Chloroflexota bacterium]